MSDLLIASSQADAEAAEAVEQHHAAMAGALQRAVELLLAAAVDADGHAAEAARRDLLAWCDRELVPHAKAEEQTLYPSARALDEGRLLIDGMLAEHAVIIGLIADLRSTLSPVRAAAAAVALRTIFDAHLEKENGLLLPLLAADPATSIAKLLDGMHDVLGLASSESQPGVSAEEAEEDHHAGGHQCACGHTDDSDLPELDVREVPHKIRHATVLGALESVERGTGMVLVAPHDPLPLLGQIQRRWPGAFTIDYLERGPEAWRIELQRVA